MPTSDLINTIHATWDGADRYGSATMWLFGVCAALDARGADIPDEWDYRPGAGRLDRPESFQDEACWHADTQELLHVGRLMHELRRRLEAAGYAY